MGVPKFFRYISERYPCLSEKLKEYQIPEFDNLYLDMNGIIHCCSHPNDADASFRITEETIFKNIFHYIEILFRFIKPQKLFFMAVDGVAPRAKINQQRGRRFRSAKDAEIQEAKARAKGQEIPKEARFDSNCITPGTVFMARLNEQLKYFITYKISTDKLWQKCKIILSGSEVPGEGEHKIMDYIRYMKAQPDYDGNTRHCLYGLDADLIMLGLCSHEPHFSLLREEVKFGKAQKKILTPEETNFCLLHLSLMREYLEHEFSPIRDKINFKFDIEKIIDDWVLMGFLVGNDFIPHLPNLHIENGALPILYNAYMEVLPTLDGYINEAGTLNLERFEKFMEKLAHHDMVQFDEIYTDLKYFESKTGKRQSGNTRNHKNLPDESASPKRTLNKDLEALLMATEAELGDDDDDEEDDSEEDMDADLHLEFVQHKRDYYMNKMEYENVDAEIMRSQAEGYIRAIQWNLHYYYNGCCSWSWYYPHHYAPFISDIKNFKNLKLEFELGEPFLPFQQLLAVLPAASKSLLPKAYHNLMTEENSPIIKYYPVDFKTDLNGKRQEWEAVVLIPLIDEKNLIAAMEPCNKWLTEEERQRNKHGPMMVFSYANVDQGVYKAPAYFPAVRNYAKLQLVDRNEILIPREKLVKGLCKGVKLSVYYPGFPTLQYVDHTACLLNAKVKVFDQPSRRENMILTVQPKPIPPLEEIAKKWLGKSVFVGWPHLIEAYVIGVSTTQKKISIVHPNQATTSEKLKFHSETIDPNSSGWNLQKKNITENYKTRLGIEVNNIEVLVLACPIIGRQYVYSSQGKMTLEKQWSEVAMAYAYQVVLHDIAIHNPEFIQFTSIADVFTPKSICFMLGHPYYGTMGEVTDEGVCLKTGRVKVAMLISEEPSFEMARQLQSETRQRYMPGGVAAQRLGISSHLLSRVTGTMFVISGDIGESGNIPKVNIGLNLKFNKKNEEVQGFTKKDPNGGWLYSTKALAFVDKYICEFPELFDRIERNSVSSDIFHKSDLFPPESTITLDKTVAWIKEQQKLLGAQTMQRCGTEELETEVVKKIEEEIDTSLPFSNRVSILQVKPHLLYKPGLNSPSLPPDSKAYHRLFDRIVCVRESFTVPTGYKGTIIGVQRGENAMANVYEVIFDKSFPGGLVIRNCSQNRGYRLACTDFINISYGKIVESRINNPTASTPNWRNHQPQQTKQDQSKTPSGGNYMLPPDPSIINCVFKDFKISDKKEQQQPVKLLKRNSDAKTMDKPQTDKPGPKEFQALWDCLDRTAELKKASKQSLNIAKNVEDSSVPSPLKAQRSVAQNLQSSLAESTPQDPSAFLKAVLKISDESPKPPSSVPSSNVGTTAVMSTKLSTNAASTTKTSATMSAAINALSCQKIQSFPLQQTQVSKANETSPSVQQLFDQARQAEIKTGKSTWYCSQILSYYQLLGVGFPLYTYCKNKDDLIMSQITLPDGRIFHGEFCRTSSEAAESAGKKVYEELQLDKAIAANARIANTNRSPQQQMPSTQMPISLQLQQQLPQKPLQQPQQPQQQLQQQQQQQPQQLQKQQQQKQPQQPQQQPQKPQQPQSQQQQQSQQQPQHWLMNRMQRPGGPPGIKPLLPSAFPSVPMMQMPMPKWNVMGQSAKFSQMQRPNSGSQRSRFPQPPFQHVQQQPPPMHNQMQNQGQFPLHNQHQLQSSMNQQNQHQPHNQYQQTQRSHHQQSPRHQPQNQQQQTKKSTPFVPLQAQKKSRKQVNVDESKKAKDENKKPSDSKPEHKHKDNATKEKKQDKNTGGNKSNENLTQNNQAQNLPKNNQKSGGQKQRRSRVAAKFMADPVANGSERN